MRKVVIVFAAAASLLLAGSFAYRADATTGAGTLGLPAAAKTYSPIEQAPAKAKRAPSASRASTCGAIPCATACPAEPIPARWGRSQP